MPPDEIARGGEAARRAAIGRELLGAREIADEAVHGLLELGLRTRRLEARAEGAVVLLDHDGERVVARADRRLGGLDALQVRVDEERARGLAIARRERRLGALDLAARDRERRAGAAILVRGAAAEVREDRREALLRDAGRLEIAREGLVGVAREVREAVRGARRIRRDVHVAEAEDVEREGVAIVVGELREGHHRRAADAEADRRRDARGREAHGHPRVGVVGGLRIEGFRLRAVAATGGAVAVRAELLEEILAADGVGEILGRVRHAERREHRRAGLDRLGADFRVRGLRVDLRRDGLHERDERALAFDLLGRGVEALGDRDGLAEERALLVVLGLRGDGAVAHRAAVVGGDVAEQVREALRLDLGGVPLIGARRGRDEEGQEPHQREPRKAKPGPSPLVEGLIEHGFQ